jgi:glycosyltransferase involved in cell wall biosynthesis
MVLAGALDESRLRRSILVVSEDDLYPGHFGGMEIRGRQLVDDFRQMCNVSVLSRRGLTMQNGSYHPVRVPVWRLAKDPNHIVRVRRWLIWAFRNMPFTIGGRRRLRGLLSAVHPDLVYLHKFGTLHPGILDELIRFHAPVIAWFGDTYAGQQLRSFASGTWAYRLILGIRSSSSHLPGHLTAVFNCHFLQRFYAPLFAGDLPQHVVYDGVDTDLFHPASTQLSSPRFVFLGRATHKKGFIDFCRALSLLPREFICSIDVIADGAALAEGLAILRASGRSDFLRQVGLVPHEDVPQILRRSTICVHPSYGEGMPAGVVEAMACGLAVIATDVGGTSEAIAQGVTGLLVSPGALADLVQVCRMLASSEDLRRRLGRNARRCVASRFDQRDSAEQMKQLIASVIQRYQPTKSVWS